MKTIPPDAFARYVAQGAHRSYQRLSSEIGISKRSIVVRASREGWQERLRSLEANAQAEATKLMQEDINAVYLRHLRAMRAIQARALETLRSKPLETARDAVWALALAQKEEERLLGADASSSRVRLTVERGVRERFERRTVAIEGAPTAALSEPPT